jgi:hypothetical protein
MARYDSPGFVGAFPTGPLDARQGMAPGSEAGSEVAGPEVGRVRVSLLYGSSQVNRPAVPVGADQTSALTGDENGTEGFTGVALDRGGAGAFQPGSGRANHHRHPGAGR